MTGNDVEWLLGHGFKELENGTWIYEMTFEDVIYHADILLSENVYLCNVQMQVNKIVDGVKTCKATFLGNARLDKNARCAFEKANCMCLLNQMFANQLFLNANKQVSKYFLDDENDLCGEL